MMKWKIVEIKLGILMAQDSGWSYWLNLNLIVFKGKQNSYLIKWPNNFQLLKKTIAQNAPNFDSYNF